MKVYTKTGDKGKTSLYDNTRVSKASLRVESYGTIDELNSSLGIAKNYVDHQEIKDFIEKIQRNLFNVAGELATSDYETFKFPVDEDDIQELEETMDKFIAPQDKKDIFILPGTNTRSAYLHLSRTICRRAERRILALKESEKVSDTVHKFVNRLSDLIFVFASFLETEYDYIDFDKSHRK